MTKRTCNVCSLMLNLTLFILVAYSVAHNFRTDIIREEVEWFTFVGFENLRYFTTLSNIFCAVTAVITLFFNVKNVLHDEFEFPFSVTVLKYMSATAISVTFFTVVILLSPMVAINGKSYFLLFKGNSFFMHFFCPLLAILNFLLFERTGRLKFKHTFLAMIPTAIYAAVYLLCVIAFKVWPDFYNFTFNGNFWAVPLVVLGMTALTFGLATVIYFVHKKACDKGFAEQLPN